MWYLRFTSNSKGIKLRPPDSAKSFEPFFFCGCYQHDIHIKGEWQTLSPVLRHALAREQHRKL